MKNLMLALSLVALAGCSSIVEVSPSALNRALPECQMIPDGVTLDVVNEGQYLAGKKDDLNQDILIEELRFGELYFTTPQRKPIDTYITRRNSLDKVPQDYYARITRHGLLLTIELIHGDGRVAAILELPTMVIHKRNGFVLRHEEHFDDTGDHPTVHVTVKADFFVTKSGDWVIRFEEQRSGWLFFYYVMFETGSVIEFKHLANKK